VGIVLRCQKNDIAVGSCSGAKNGIRRDIEQAIRLGLEWGTGDIANELLADKAESRPSVGSLVKESAVLRKRVSESA
jgi:hypothetical protein